MVNSFTDILDAQLSEPISCTSLSIIRHIRSLHPNSQFLPTIVGASDDFPLTEYLVTVLQTCPKVLTQDSHLIYSYDSSQANQKTYPEALAGIVTFTYKDTEFRTYKISWGQDWQANYLYGLVYDGPDDTLGQEFATAVYKYANSLKKEIWVYEAGRWAKSKQLHKSIRSANWNDIVLKEEFKEGLRRDTETFFHSKDVYDSLGITWKRGILLLGPPGNGKTESIKALLNEFDQSALYVKSFTTDNGPEFGVRSIFSHARKHAPCILVLEDLDSMITPKVRSFLLNELDGLAQNNGILTIATTNHPERIDDAILNRPSRFDVKYNFSLPGPELRKAFAMKWIHKIEGIGATAAVGYGIVFEEKIEDVAEKVSQRTEGWSFAFLKELFVSFLLRLAHDQSLRVLKSESGVTDGSVEGGATPPEIVLLNQVQTLYTNFEEKKEGRT